MFQDFLFAGVQNKRECYCGNWYYKHGKADNCDLQCDGDPNEICGGRWANSVYITSKIRVFVEIDSEPIKESNLG